MKNETRAAFHKKNNSVEAVLTELQELLEPANSVALANLNASAKPTIHLVGCARSGTTLLLQILARNLEVCYPTNFLSRFFYAPYIGAKMQLLLNDLDYKKEILAAFPAFDFSSTLGKTKGPLSPHEFWYFWRSIFDVNELGWLKNVNQQTLTRFYDGIDSMTSVFQKPMVMKSMIAQNSIAEFLKFRAQDKVIYLKRNTAFNAQSLLQARQEYFGDIKRWYSFIPKNYEIYGTPYEQVVQQVKHTNNMIEDQLTQLNRESYLEVNYEDIGERMNEIFEWTGLNVTSSNSKEDDQLLTRNSVKINQADFDKILQFT